MSLLATVSLIASAHAHGVILTEATAKTVSKTSTKYRFVVSLEGYVYSDGDIVEASQYSDCTINAIADTLTCSSRITADDVTTDAALLGDASSITWKLGDDLDLSGGATASISNGFLMSFLSSTKVTVDGNVVPSIVADWVLENILATKDVLIYVDGYCVNCIDEL